MKEQLCDVRVEVTLSDTATIFTGPDTVYRYDLPLSGVGEGWAVSAISQQVKDLSHPSWPNVEVAIKGPPECVNIVCSALLAQGVTAFPVGVQPEPVVQRKKRGIKPGYISLVACILLVCCGAMVFVYSGARQEIVPTSSTTGVTTTRSSSSQGITYKGGMSSPSTVSDSSAVEGAASQMVQLNGLRVPSSVQWEVVGDGLVGRVLSSSSQQEQRILVLRDHVYEDALMRDLIAEDPLLEETLPIHGRENTIDYVEQPGDGSIVYWSSWRESPVRISVGCHTQLQAQAEDSQLCANIIENTQVVKGSR